MYAVFANGGKQYKAKVGDTLFLEKIDQDVDSEVTFDQILLISNDDNKITVGNPIIAGATIKAKVEKHGKEKKVVTFKYKAKKHYHTKQGHRQPYTRVSIESINV